MMSSLFSAISGLQTHNDWMTVIANNIANVDTTAYKSQRITFRDQIYQSLGSASGANELENLGGVNPEELGLGDVVGSIDTLMTQGALQTTGNSLDVAITGSGFFTVKSGNTVAYTRAGNFGQDDLGNVVTSSGAILQGWEGTFTRTTSAGPQQTGSPNPLAQVISDTYEVNSTDPSKIGNINIPTDLEMAAQMTSKIDFAGNLDAETPVNAACYVPIVGGLVVANNVATALPSNYAPDQLPAAGQVVSIDQVDQGLTPVTATAWPPVAANTNCAYFHVGGAVGAAMVTPDAQTTITCYDSLGNKRSITVWYFQHGVNTDPAAPADARPVWDWYAFDTTYVAGSAKYTGTPDYFNCIGGTNIQSAPVNPLTNAVDTNYNTAPATFTIDPGDVYSPIWFNNDGSLASNGGTWQFAGAAGLNGRQAQPTLNLVQNPSASQGLMPDGAISIQQITANFGTGNIWQGGAGLPDTLNVNNPIAPFNSQVAVGTANALGQRDGLVGDVMGSFQNINGVQTYVPDSTAYAKDQNGFGAGTLTGLSVGTDGTVNGQFSNQQTIGLAKISLAVFANPEGLQKEGNSLYSTTSNSGVARMVTAANAGATLTGGALEASNVDLSTELTNMIVAQAGFNANARIVTVDSDMLTTLTQLGR